MRAMVVMRFFGWFLIAVAVICVMIYVFLFMGFLVIVLILVPIVSWIVSIRQKRTVEIDTSEGEKNDRNQTSQLRM